MPVSSVLCHLCRHLVSGHIVSHQVSPSQLWSPTIPLSVYRHLQDLSRGIIFMGDKACWDKIILRILGWHQRACWDIIEHAGIIVEHAVISLLTMLGLFWLVCSSNRSTRGVQPCTVLSSLKVVSSSESC